MNDIKMKTDTNFLKEEHETVLSFNSINKTEPMDCDDNYTMNECEYSTFKIIKDYKKDEIKCNTILNAFTNAKVKKENKDIMMNYSSKNHTSLLKSTTHKQISGDKRKCNENLLQCAHCSYSSYNRNLFIGHVSIHMNRQFECAECSKKFLRKASLVNHIKAHNRASHDQTQTYRSSNKYDDKFVCDICGLTFTKVCNRNRHFRTRHGGNVSRHFCSYCHYSTPRRSLLKHHILTHTRGRPYKCGYCGRAYARTYSLNVHLTKHTGQDLFTCRLCNVKLLTKQGIQQHLRNHKETPNSRTSKRYSCAQCKATFNNRISMTYHLEMHERQLTCGDCGYITNKKRDLIQHLKTHDKQRELGQQEKEK